MSWRPLLLSTDYILHGKNIVHLIQGNDKLHFFYDASNKPAIVEFNETRYGYVQNLQGDICQIIDANGTVVVEYTYDAWGKVLNVTGSMAGTLGKIQPFRYRGYVYDVETGLYYLRNRYYKSKWHRFVNADRIISNDTSFDNNLFCYCSNSPLNNNDETGCNKRNIPLWGNRYYRIDPAKQGTMEKKHIHIYEDGKEYSQNEDGSTHKGNKGEPSNTVKKYLNEKGIWDWDGKRTKFLDDLKYTLKHAKTVDRVLNDEMGFGVLVKTDDSSEFYCDEDFIAVGGVIDGWKAYLPNTYPLFLPMIKIPILPVFTPVILQIPVIIF